MNRSRIVSRAGVGVCAVLVALSLAACGTRSEQKWNLGGSELVSYATVNEEYSRAVAALEWPSSYTPPADLDDGSSPAESYQKGYGDTRASMLFECAWEKEWLRTYATDRAKAGVAIEHLSQVPKMRYMQDSRADDTTRRFFKDYLDRAELGDPSGFQENVELNCSE